VSQREKVLTMLEQAGTDGVTNGQFVNVSILRYSARIKELRDAGHRIEKHRVTDGTFRYTLYPAKQPSLSGEGRYGDTEVLGESTAGGKLPPDLTPRGDGSNCGQAKRSQRQTVAVTSGEGVENPGTGGGAPPHPAALPTLFDMPRSGQTSHYEEAA
jgi:hypothetical protein